jgi:hypothetical protein
MTTPPDDTNRGAIRVSKGAAVLGLLISLLPLAFMVLCVVHAVRNGNIFPWIYVIVLLPGIGSLIYFFMEIVPGLTRSRQAAALGAGIRAAADPGRSLREAHRAAEMVGSVDAKRVLAEQYIARGNYVGAVAIYQDAAQGQFKDDPALLLGLARAQFLSGDAAGTQVSLDALQAADPSFASGDAHLLYARALEGQGKNDEALAEYRRLVVYYSVEEARARFGQLLEKMGQRDEARAVYQQVIKSLDGAPSRYQKAQKEWGDIARRGLR